MKVDAGIRSGKLCVVSLATYLSCYVFSQLASTCIFEEEHHVLLLCVTPLSPQATCSSAPQSWEVCLALREALDEALEA